MMSVKEFRSWAEEDYSEWDAAKLRFHLGVMLRRAIESLEWQEQRHDEQLRMMRGHISASSYLYSELLSAQRKRRKTIRIDEVVAASQAHFERAFNQDVEVEA